MRVRLPVSAVAIAAFLVVAGGFCGGLAIAVGGGSAAPPPAPGTVAEPDMPPAIHVYHPLPDPLLITLPDGRTVTATLTLSVEAPLETLLDLQATAKQQQSEIMASLLETAQGAAQSAADHAELLTLLPRRLTGVLNARLGSDTLPDPVKEVLLSAFLLR